MKDSAAERCTELIKEPTPDTCATSVGINQSRVHKRMHVTLHTKFNRYPDAYCTHPPKYVENYSMFNDLEMRLVHSRLVDIC
jgi:hypothetical protein